MHRRAQIFAGGALLLWGVFVVACAPLVNRILLFPSSDPQPLAGAQRVMIADAGGALETIRGVSRGAESRPVAAIVLRFYGNADRADRWVSLEAERFGDWPIELWGVNYQGFGQSEGTATLRGVARSADVAYAEAAKRGLPVYAMGTSMGSAAALYLARQGKLSGLLLHNPPPLPQLIRGRYGWWNLWLLAGPISWSIPPALNSLKNAAKSTTPLVLVSAEADTLVPIEYQTSIYEAYTGEKERFIMLAAGHNDRIPEELWGRIRETLARQGWK